MIQFKIDTTNSDGINVLENGKLFDTYDMAVSYLSHFVKRVEVGYLVTMQIGDKPSRYVWTTEDVDNGGCVDCPNGTDDCYNTDIEACFVRDELEEYAEEKGYTNVSFGIEEVIL